MNKDDSIRSSKDIFEKFRSSIMNVDPVAFCEKYMTLDGKPFRLRGNGYKPFVDIYRYIGIQSLSNKAIPIILVKGRQVGATTMGANLEMYWMGSGIFGRNGRPPMRVIHCFPQLDLATYYAKAKLNQTIARSVRIDDKNGKTTAYMEKLLDSTTKDSLYYKKFMDGNTASVDSIGIEGDRIRGRTYDCAIFDEVQDMHKRAISNTIKILAQSQYGKKGTGIQVYMGTPKAKDGVYYEMWEASTKAYFHLGCEACKETFPLYTPGSDDWEEIWLDEDDPECTRFDVDDRGYIVKCSHCGHTQDKRLAAERGEWKRTREFDDDKEDIKYVGFHINQLYMPIFNKKAIISQKPENNPLSDETSWNNEVLGEFFSGSDSTLTVDEIIRNCGDFDRTYVSRISNDSCKNGRNVYMGIDWGKKIDTSQLSKGDIKNNLTGGKSFSTLVVLQVEGPKLLSVKFATKLAKRDLQYKLDVVNQAMINYNVKCAVGDIGYGHEIMGELQQMYGRRFLASEASGAKIQGRIKFDENDFPMTIRFEKDVHIGEMFRLLKSGGIRFPLHSKTYEQIAWLMQHCCSMVSKPQMDRYGNERIRFCKGPTPNDGLMALINAYLAYKFDVTGGFRGKSKLFSEDPSNTRIGLAIGAVIPKMRLTG